MATPILSFTSSYIASLIKKEALSLFFD